MQDDETRTPVVPDEPVTSDDISPQGDIEVPELPPATKTDGVLGEFEQGADDFQQNLQREAEESREARDTSLEDLIKASEEAPTRTETQIQQEEEVGLGGIREELNDINQEIREEQRSLQNQLRELDKNPQGLFGGALEDERIRVKNESLRRQADLSIIQMGIQERFDSAKAIADRATQAIFERREQKIGILDKVFEENKELFTRDEQRAFQAAQSERKRQFDEEKEARKNITDTALNALQNGAPRNVVDSMLASESLNDAIQVGGQYVNALARREAALKIAALEEEVAGKKTGESYGGVSPEELPELDNTQRTDLINSWTMSRSMERMSQLVNEVGLAGLITGQGSPAAREFAQIKENVIDILGRERTGAVIGKDEAKQFRKILGVGILSTLTAEDEEELKSIITRVKPNIDATIDTIDPEGQWKTYLDSKYPSGKQISDPLGLGVGGTTSDPLGINE